MHPSTLTLELHGYPPELNGHPTGGPERHYTLDWVDLGSSDIEDLSLLSEQGALHFTANSPLYLNNAHLFQGRVTSGDLEHPVDVICKLVETDVSRLQNEAKLYATVLEDVRGSIVPSFYGYFAGRSSHGKAACILLQYGGVTLSRDDWAYSPFEMRMKILDDLMELHLRGIYHGHFTSTDVVVDETGHCLIIDFDDAWLHECYIEDIEFELFQLKPTLDEMPCQELRNVSEEMCVWTPRRARFCGMTTEMIPMPSVEDLVKQAQERKSHLSITPEEWRQKAERFLIYHEEASQKRKRILEEIEARKATADGEVDDALAYEKPPVTKQLGRLSIHGPSATRSPHEN